MRGRSLIVVALVLALASFAFAGTTPEVITLSDTDFLDTIAESPNAVWLVELYVYTSHSMKRFLFYLMTDLSIL